MGKVLAAFITESEGFCIHSTYHSEHGNFATVFFGSLPSDLLLYEIRKSAFPSI